MSAGAPKGNKYWQFRSKDGKEPKYKPEGLWDKAVMYFEWVEANPLKEQQLFAYQGTVNKESADLMRAMTFDGLQLFLDISHTTWDNYKKKKDYIAITSRIERIIREQKFTGASANLLNPNIIARDLGLRDDQKIDSDITITVKREKKPPIDER